MSVCDFYKKRFICTTASKKSQAKLARIFELEAPRLITTCVREQRQKATERNFSLVFLMEFYLIFSVRKSIAQTHVNVSLHTFVYDEKKRIISEKKICLDWSMAGIVKSRKEKRQECISQ